MVRQLKDIQAALTALIAQAELLDKDDTKKDVSADLEKRYPQDGRYQSPYPVLFGRLHMEVSKVGYLATHMDELIQDAELAERLQTVTERMEVYANIDRFGRGKGPEDNTRELRLLEILTTDENYAYERRQLEAAIAKTLNAVEEGEWEAEYEKATTDMEAAGFVRVEDDILDGWRRIVDGVVEEIVIDTVRNNKDFSYKFEYEKKLPNGAVLLNGKSGEFAKLLEVVGVPVATAA